MSSENYTTSSSPVAVLRRHYWYSTWILVIHPMISMGNWAICSLMRDVILVLKLTLINQVILSNMRVVWMMKLHILIHRHLGWNSRLRCLLFLLIKKSIKTNKVLICRFILLNSVSSLSIFWKVIFFYNIGNWLNSLIMISCHLRSFLILGRFHVKIKQTNVIFWSFCKFLFLYNGLYRFLYRFRRFWYGLRFFFLTLIWNIELSVFIACKRIWLIVVRHPFSFDVLLEYISAYFLQTCTSFWFSIIGWDVLIGSHTICLPESIYQCVTYPHVLEPLLLPFIQIGRPHSSDSWSQTSMCPRTVRTEKDTKVKRSPYIIKNIQVGAIESQSAQLWFSGFLRMG